MGVGGGRGRVDRESETQPGPGLTTSDSQAIRYFHISMPQGPRGQIGSLSDGLAEHAEGKGGGARGGAEMNGICVLSGATPYGPFVCKCAPAQTPRTWIWGPLQRRA